LRDCHWCPCSERSLAAEPAAHLQTFLAIGTTQFLVVHDEALAVHQDAQAAIAEPAADSRQFAQAQSYTASLGLPLR